VNLSRERHAYPLGDCHPGAVLLPGLSELLLTSSQLPTLAVIDWEFSSASGRGVNGDMAQFLASLHCHWIYLEALWNTSTPKPGAARALAFTKSLIHGVCTSYAEVSAFNKDRSPTSSTMQLFRSALITHGREVIIQAVVREWDTSGLDIPTSVLVAQMVATGARYLEIAGEDTRDMLSTWAGHNEDRRVIETLFGLSSNICPFRGWQGAS
jgi:hypothetical protein